MFLSRSSLLLSSYPLLGGEGFLLQLGDLLLRLGIHQRALEAIEGLVWRRDELGDGKRELMGEAEGYIVHYGEARPGVYHRHRDVEEGIEGTKLSEIGDLRWSCHIGDGGEDEILKERS